MKKRWIFSVLHVLIIYLCARGQPKDDIETDERVHATAGSDVTFTCILKGNMAVTQVQWSHIVDRKPTMIAVHNPSHGTSYGSLNGSCSNISAEFKAPGTWTLHLIGVTPALTGLYSCNFATYPYGTKSEIINLSVQTEEEMQRVQEIILKETFEIHCVENISSVYPSILSWRWSMGQNGSQTILFTSENHTEGSYSVLGDERIQLLKNDTLRISPARVLDDGRNFSCHMETQQKKIKSTITLKAFAVPEISLTLRNLSSSEVNLSCIIRKAYPKPNLIWYRNEVELHPEKSEISVFTDEIREADGFFQLKSVIILGTDQRTKNHTFWCTTPASLPGKGMQRISSRRISITPYQEDKVTSSSPLTIITINEELQKSTFTTPEQIKMNTSFPSLGYTTSAPSSQHSPSPSDSTVTGFLNISATNSTGSDFVNQSIWGHPNDDITTESSTVSSDTSTKHDGSPGATVKPFTNVTTLLTSTIELGGFLTTRQLFNVTGHIGKSPHSAISWPALVSILLFICTLLVVFMIRRWYQYRREIMDRPPPFKPPPPPIKYTSMQESDGTEASCHELENL